MFQLLIIDDEIYAVKGVVDGINWGRLNVTKVYEAYHAKEAKDILDREPIDLIICDIEMPEENGLELLEWAKTSHPDIEAVFLTCHSDFKYAQKALQLGSRDYLLKPVLYEELEAVLEKNLGKISKKRSDLEKMESFKKYYNLWHFQKPQLINMFWREVINRPNGNDVKKLEQAVRDYELSLKDKEKLLLILVSVEEWGKTTNASDEEIIGFAIRNTASEVIVGDYEGHVIEDEYGNSLVILYLQGDAEQDRDTLKQRCEAFIRACWKYFSCKLSCYIGDVIPFSKVNPEYHRLKEAEYRNFTKKCTVLLYKDSGDHEDKCETTTFFQLTESLENGDMEQICRLIDQAVDTVRKRNSREAMEKVYQGFLQTASYVLMRKGLSSNILISQDLLPAGYEASDSFEQLRRWMERIAAVVVSHARADSQNHRTSSIVYELQCYIRQHLDQRLTRDDLSELVHLNGSYLSRLFSKETGMSLSNYILQEKMKKAVELISSNDEPIYGIANQLCYENFSYFSKMFKKVYHVTPQEYRKRF